MKRLALCLFASLLVLGVCSLKQETSCHPECRWQCDDPVCPAVCHPICERPKCEMSCQETPCAKCTIHCERPVCEVRCPKDMCEKDDCPKCETVCQPARCHTTCEAPQPACQPVCEEPKCEWKCRKPTMCPKPKCELQCERPACEAQPESCCSCSQSPSALAAIELANRNLKGAQANTMSLLEVVNHMKASEQESGSAQCCPCAAAPTGEVHPTSFLEIHERAFPEMFGLSPPPAPPAALSSMPPQFDSFNPALAAQPRFAQFNPPVGFPSAPQAPMGMGASMPPMGFQPTAAPQMGMMAPPQGAAPGQMEAHQAPLTPPPMPDLPPPPDIPIDMGIFSETDSKVTKVDRRH